MPLIGPFPLIYPPNYCLQQHQLRSSRETLKVYPCQCSLAVATTTTNAAVVSLLPELEWPNQVDGGVSKRLSPWAIMISL